MKRAHAELEAAAPTMRDALRPPDHAPARPRSVRLRPLRILSHPLWLAALGLLLVNDHLFKSSGRLPAFVTGKLSDVAGMLVAPALLALVVRSRSRWVFAACHVVVGALFAAIKLSGGAAALVERAFALVGLSWRIWVDASDLVVAIPALVASYAVFVRVAARPLALRSRVRRVAELGAGLVGLIACMGTSQVPVMLPPTPIDEPLEPLPPPAPVFAMAALEGGVWIADGRGPKTSYRFAAGGRYLCTVEGHPDETGQARYASEPYASRTGSLSLRERVMAGRKLADLVRSATIAPDDTSFTLDGRVFRKSGAAVMTVAQPDGSARPDASASSSSGAAPPRP